MTRDIPVTEQIIRFIGKHESIFVHIVLPLFLVLYALDGILQGADITDTMYSLANYENFGSLDPMWAIATFLPNVTGAILSHLPGGGTMAGMNIYCTVFVVLPALLA